MNRYLYTANPEYDASQVEGMVTRCVFSESIKTVIDLGIWKTEVVNFGWIEYAAPLTMHQIAEYGLEPVNPVEWAHYQFFASGNIFTSPDTNIDAAFALEREYLEYSDEILADEEMPKFMRCATLILRNEKK
jgi:hypothetical protein